MSYGWIITKDVICEGEAVGTKGPRAITPDLEHRLDSGEGVRFRMTDDDGEMCYYGRLVFEDQSDEVVEHRQFPECQVLVCSSLPEEAFGPLWDFGEPNVGATSIEFADSDGRWGVL